MSSLETFFGSFDNPADLVGHFAYVLLITSMLMRSMHLLRAVAISAGTLSAVYYAILGDYVSLFWESLFAAVNAVQLLILLIENRRGRFSAEERRFIDSVLKGVERGQVRRLMKLGAWSSVASDFTMVREGVPPSHLYYIAQGTARVERAGRRVGVAGAGDFIGEMSYLNGGVATATVTTESPTQFLSFDRSALRRHLERHPEVRHALEAGFNRNLVEKLVRTSQELRKAVDPAVDESVDQPQAEAIEELASLAQQGSA